MWRFSLESSFVGIFPAVTCQANCLPAVATTWLHIQPTTRVGGWFFVWLQVRQHLHCQYVLVPLPLLLGGLTMVLDDVCVCVCYDYDRTTQTAQPHKHIIQYHRLNYKRTHLNVSHICDRRKWRKQAWMDVNVNTVGCQQLVIPGIAFDKLLVKSEIKRFSSHRMSALSADEVYHITQLNQMRQNEAAVDRMYGRWTD